MFTYHKPKQYYFVEKYFLSFTLLTFTLLFTYKSHAIENSLLSGQVYTFYSFYSLSDINTILLLQLSQLPFKESGQLVTKVGCLFWTCSMLPSLSFLNSKIGSEYYDCWKLFLVNTAVYKPLGFEHLVIGAENLAKS